MDTCENKGEAGLDFQHGASVFTSGDLSVAVIQEKYACRNIGTGLSVHPCSLSPSTGLVLPLWSEKN